jgi:hypothetical protein
VPNKCTFKKLLGSIHAACNASYETETVANKIEDIKARIKSVAGLRNNALVDFELDYLFDQRWANLEPAYEKVSLVDEVACLEEEEFVDLTRGCKPKADARVVSDEGASKVKNKRPMAGRAKCTNKIVVSMKIHVD